MTLQTRHFDDVTTMEEAARRLSQGLINPFDTFVLHDGGVCTARDSGLLEGFDETLAERLISEALLSKKNGNGGYSPLLLLPCDANAFNEAFCFLASCGFCVVDTRKGYQKAIDDLPSNWKSGNLIPIGEEDFFPLLILADSIQGGITFWRILYDTGWLATGGLIPPTPGLSNRGEQLPENSFCVAMVQQNHFNEWRDPSALSRFDGRYCFGAAALTQPWTKNPMDRSGVSDAS